jgi:hypothetical protein
MIAVLVYMSVPVYVAILVLLVYICLSLYGSGAGRENIAVCLGFDVCRLFVFSMSYSTYVLLALISISNKSLYLLKVRRLRQKISFPQIRSMTGIVKMPTSQVCFRK